MQVKLWCVNAVWIIITKILKPAQKPHDGEYIPRAIFEKSSLHRLFITQNIHWKACCLAGHRQIWHNFFDQKILKYFNNFQIRSFSVLRLKWTQTMELTQNQTFFHVTYSDLTPYLYQKLLKYFSYFHNWNFSVLWLKWTQTMEMKQNQTFSHETCKSNIIFHWLQNTKIFHWLL